MDKSLGLGRDDQRAVDHIAQEQNFSPEAALHMLAALARGGGSMAQFNHPEFGGSGQWMRGGMTMVSDLFNHALKARVDALCGALADLIAKRPELATRMRPAETAWWPQGLGSPDGTGSQNDRSYAYFAGKQRLALSDSGRITVYDTLGHRISGVSQQQSGRGHVVFTSQEGLVDLAALPVVWSNSPAPQPTRNDGRAAAGEPAPEPAHRPAPHAPSPGPSHPGEQVDPIAMIERLAALREKNILTDEEFQTKKAELLARL